MSFFYVFSYVFIMNNVLAIEQHGRVKLSNNRVVKIFSAFSKNAGIICTALYGEQSPVRQIIIKDRCHYIDRCYCLARPVLPRK